MQPLGASAPSPHEDDLVRELASMKVSDGAAYGQPGHIALEQANASVAFTAAAQQADAKLEESVESHAQKLEAPPQQSDQQPVVGLLHDPLMERHQSANGMC